MKPPTITLDDDQDVPLTEAPTEILRSFVGGNFDLIETGPFENPVVAQAIAARILQERMT